MGLKKLKEVVNSLRRHIKEQAVRFSVAEALALGIGFAGCGTGSEGVQRAAGVEVVSRDASGVAHEAAAS
jgi:hypothetical protein